MARRESYRAITDVVLLAGGQGTLEYTPGPNETFHIKEWRFISTGIFNIIDIRNSENYHYTNCSVTHPILSSMVQNPGNAFLSDKIFDPPLEIKPRINFAVDVIDTSAAGNTVRMLLIGEKEIG